MRTGPGGNKQRKCDATHVHTSSLHLEQHISEGSRSSIEDRPGPHLELLVPIRDPRNLEISPFRVGSDDHRQMRAHKDVRRVWIRRTMSRLFPRRSLHRNLIRSEGRKRVSASNDESDARTFGRNLTFIQTPTASLELPSPFLTASPPPILATSLIPHSFISQSLITGQVALATTIISFSPGVSPSQGSWSFSLFSEVRRLTKTADVDRRKRRGEELLSLMGVEVDWKNG